MRSKMDDVDWMDSMASAANSFHIAVGVNADHSGVNAVEKRALTPWKFRG